MADFCLVFGFVLLVLGVGLLSVPAACIVGGSVLFFAGLGAYWSRPDA